ncbi:hypothetical protein PR048_013843 [Dryococelus australis]|uniref:Uncharacterized protein n=1 Tax=Dryococelus australis TaxID=614101 RepID=A0ABQ9HTB8_9NEOP|nr:hypothetical protein PR048_013843 [Dryococelus australis]
MPGETSENVVGRSVEQRKLEAFNKLCNFLDDNDDCQYPLSDLMQMLLKFSTESDKLCINTSSEVQDNGFVQFVFDNADHNTRTVDGRGTFHMMGGVQCVTPSSTVKTSSPVTRPKILPTANIIESLTSTQSSLTNGPRTID